MAISVPTLLSSGSSTENRTNPYTLGTHTFTGGRLYLLFLKMAEQGGLVETPTVSGGSTTWTVVADASDASMGCVVYRYRPATTQTAVAIEAGTGGFANAHDGMSYAFIEVASGFDTSGTNGSGAIANSNTATTGEGTVTSLSLTLQSQAGETLTLGGCAAQENFDQTVGSGFTVLANKTANNTGHPNPDQVLMVQYDNVGVGTTVDFSSVNAVRRRLVGVMLKAPGGIATVDKTHSTSVIARSTVDKAHSTSVIVKLVSDLTHSTDVRVLRVGNLTHTADVIVKRTPEAEARWGSDTPLDLPIDETTTADNAPWVEFSELVVFQPPGVALDHSTDVIVRATPDKTHSTDMIARDTVDATHDTDVMVQGSNAVTHRTDVIVSSTSQTSVLLLGSGGTTNDQTIYTTGHEATNPQWGMWFGAAGNPWSPGNDFAAYEYYRPLLGREPAFFRWRGSYGQMDYPVIKSVSQATTIMNRGTHISTNLTPKTGDGPTRFPVNYQTVIDQINAASGIYYDKLLADADDLNALPPGRLVFMEMHSEANIGSPPPDAQPGIPDGPQAVGDGGGGNTLANRQRFGLWCQRIRELWESLGVTNVVYVLSLAGNTNWNGTAHRPWTEFSQDYIDCYGIDAYSFPATATVRDVGTIANSCYNAAVIDGKTMGIFETGCQAGTGNGATVNGVTYTDKASWMDQMVAWQEAHRDRSIGLVYNMSSDGAQGGHYPEDHEPFSAPAKGVEDGYTSQSWLHFKQMGQSSTLALGDPPLVPGGGSGEEGSITPTANRLCELFILSVGNGATAPSSVTGCNLTWTQIGTATAGTNPSIVLTAFRALGPAPTTGVLTVQFPTQLTGFHWAAVEASPTNVSGTNGAGGIGVSNTNTGVGTALSAALPAFASTRNPTVAAWVHRGTSITPETGWSELTETASSGPTAVLEVEWRQANDTSPTAAAAAPSGDWVGFANEIVAPTIVGDRTHSTDAILRATKDRTHTTDVALTGGAKFVAVGQALETATANAVARLKLRSTGQSTETDAAQAVGKLKNRDTGAPEEISTASVMAHYKTVNPGQAVETDTTTAVGRLKVRSIGQAVETQAAQAVGKLKLRSVAEAFESDLAQSAFAQLVGRTEVQTTAALETDTATAVARLKTRELPSILEVNVAGAVFATKLRPVGQAVETNVAQPVTRNKARTLAQPGELDTAQAVSNRKVGTVGQAVETDTAVAIAPRGGSAIVGVDLDAGLPQTKWKHRKPELKWEWGKMTR